MHGHTRGAGHIKAPANPNPVKFIPALGQADENNNPWGLGFVFFFQGIYSALVRLHLVKSTQLWSPLHETWTC